MADPATGTGRSFTSKVQNALSEIAELKAKYNITSSSSSSSSSVSGATVTGTNGSPQSSPGGLASRAGARGNQYGRYSGGDAMTRQSPAAGDAAADAPPLQLTGSGAGTGRLHDTLHDALAEIARIQSKYNVATSRSGGGSGAPPPQPHGQPHQQRERASGIAPASNGQQTRDRRPAAAATATAANDDNNTAGGTTLDARATGNGHQATRNPRAAEGAFQSHKRQEQPSSPDVFVAPPAATESAAAVAAASSLSERLSALAMSDLQSSSANGNGGNGHGSRDQQKLAAELDQERARRRKLEGLLRRSASEIRALQEQVAAVGSQDAPLLRAMEIAGVRDTRALAEWVVGAEEQRRQRRRRADQDDSSRALLATLQQRCAHLESVVQRKNQELADQRADMDVLRQDAAAAAAAAATMTSVAARDSGAATTTLAAHSQRRQQQQQHQRWRQQQQRSGKAQRQRHYGDALAEEEEEEQQQQQQEEEEEEEEQLPARGAFSARGARALVRSLSPPPQRRQQRAAGWRNEQPEPELAKFEDYRKQPRQQHQHQQQQQPHSATTLQSHHLSSTAPAISLHRAVVAGRGRARSPSPSSRRHRQLQHPAGGLQAEGYFASSGYVGPRGGDRGIDDDAVGFDDDGHDGGGSDGFAPRRQSYSASPTARHRLEQHQHQHQHHQRQQVQQVQRQRQQLRRQQEGDRKRTAATGRSRSQPPPAQRRSTQQRRSSHNSHGSSSSSSSAAISNNAGNVFRDGGGGDNSGGTASAGKGGRRPRSRSLGHAAPNSFEAQIHEVSRELAHADWEKRRDALTRLQELLRGTGDGVTPPGAWTDRVLGDLGAKMAVVLKELRSAIMKEACVVIVICGDVLGPQAAVFGAAVMPVLLSLTHCGNTTMQRYAKDCLDLAAETIPCPALLAEAGVTLLEDSSKVRRAAAGDSVRLALRFWPQHLVEAPAARKSIVQGLVHGLQDKANETRVACRAAYVEAAESFPELAHAVFDRLSKGERAKLLKYTAGTGSPSGSSAGLSSPSSR